MFDELEDLGEVDETSREFFSMELFSVIPFTIHDNFVFECRSIICGKPYCLGKKYSLIYKGLLNYDFNNIYRP